MPGDYQSRSHQIRLTPHTRCSLALLCATMLLSGCVNPQFLIPIKSDRGSSKGHEITFVRSQDSPLQEGEMRTADSTSSKPFSMQSNPASDRSSQTRVRPVSGHAFAQPKARLGRPMPLSNQTAPQGGVPSVGHSEIPLHGHSPTGSSSPQGTPASPWNASGSAWQSGTASSATFSGSADSVRTPTEFPNSGPTITAHPAPATTTGENSETSDT